MTDRADPPNPPLAVVTYKQIFLAVVKLLYPSTQHTLGQADHPLAFMLNLSILCAPLGTQIN